MSYADQIQAALRKEAAIRKWPRRIKSLGLSQRQFCLNEANIQPATLTRWIKQKVMPDDPSFNNVEETLERLDKNRMRRIRRRERSADLGLPQRYV